MRGLFITGTGTGVGKTHVSLALTRAWVQQGVRVAALKPVETGCRPHPEDALALAQAAGRPELASLPGLLRLEPPLAPAAIRAAKPSIETLVGTLRDVPAEVHLIEGAGGLLVPYDGTHDFADLARALGLPLVVVAANRLGVLHDARATLEAAAHRGLMVAALVLSDVAAADTSAETNADILRAWTHVPVHRWARSTTDESRPFAEALLASVSL